jgi:hypothetical protein
MITREQLETALDERNIKPFITKDIDHDVKAITLLRERIPYEKCKSIISGADYDVVYLCNIDIAAQYLIEEDLLVLADCNCWLDSNSECIALFV